MPNIAYQYRVDRRSENMLLPVLTAIAYVTVHTTAHNIALNRTADDQRQDFGARRGSARSPNVDTHLRTHRSCTPNDQYCIPICCESVPQRNLSACYANATFSLARDIDFSAIRDCDPSALSMNPEELVRHRKSRYATDSDTPYDMIFYLLDNGTIYENNSMNDDKDFWLDLEDYYCLASSISGDGIRNVEAICFPLAEGDAPITDINMIYVVSTVLSLPFLAATYIACAILPKFRNMHGLTLRAYVGSLFVMFVSLIIPNFAKEQLCSVLVFITYFTSVACFSWVNVMSFDIWWTFRRYRPAQSSKTQSERKKCVIYAALAWGSATLLTAVCALIDVVPNIPDSFIKPELGVKACCVFGSFPARAIYFYVPTGISVICNMYFFSSSIKTIDRQKKEIAHHLQGTDSRCHYENREKFNFAVKLCAMMIINWFMEIINCLCERNTLQYFWAIMDLTNVLQGVTIFVIFVWTDEIKQQFMKHLRFEGGSFEEKWLRLRKLGFGHQSGTKIVVIKQ